MRPAPRTRSLATFGLLLIMGRGLAAPRPAAAAEIVDRVLAVVGGEVIMLSDVTAAQVLGFVVPSARADSTREVLSRLIDRALMLAEVNRYAPPDPPAEQIADGLRAIRGRFATTA